MGGDDLGSAPNLPVTAASDRTDRILERAGSFLRILACLLVAGCQRTAEPKKSVEIVNVSYDPTRELFQEVNAAFAAEVAGSTGETVKITQSHGGSGAQSRAVLDGLDADVVTLALANDIDVLADKGLIAADWQERLPSHSTPYVSTIVLVVRKGNPKEIRDWPDLARPGVKVITPNPKTGGGSRWNFLAAWGSVTVHRKGSDAEATDLVRGIYQNVAKLDSGARGSTETFTRRQIGDVFISWENEALLVLKEFPEQYEIVYPPVSILAEPSVAWVDKVVDRRGTRDVAERYLKFLYSEPGQAIIGKHGYRPSDAQFRQKYASHLPEIPLFSIRDVTGSWRQAQDKFFVDGAIFDQIYQPKGR
jgi:sulfate/thiosulfate-binding protein